MGDSVKNLTNIFSADKGDLNPVASALAGFRVHGAAYLIYGSERRFLFYLLRPELVSQYKSPLSPDAVRNTASLE